MNDSSRILRHAGVMLLLWSLLRMAVALSQNPTVLSLSLPVLLALGFGLARWRGNLAAARLLRSAAIFLVVVDAGLLLAVLLNQPLALTLALLQHPAQGFTRFTTDGLGTALDLALLISLIPVLGHPAIRAARRAAARPPLGVRTPLALGLVLSLAIALAFHWMLGSPLAERAKREAARQLGPDYRYQVRGLSGTLGALSGDGPWDAQVLAWREGEVREIRVQGGH